MSPNENKAVAQQAVDAFNQGDWTAVDQLFAAHYIDHDRSRAELPPGPVGVKQAWQLFRAAFPDLTATIEDMVAEDDKVAVRGTLRGTQHGELLGIPPTGKRVTETLLDINRIEAGQLVERWAETDMLGLLQQLERLPRIHRQVSPGHTDAEQMALPLISLPPIILQLAAGRHRPG